MLNIKNPLQRIQDLGCRTVLYSIGRIKEEGITINSGDKSAIRKTFVTGTKYVKVENKLEDVTGIVGARRFKLIQRDTRDMSAINSSEGFIHNVCFLREAVNKSLTADTRRILDILDKQVDWGKELTRKENSIETIHVGEYTLDALLNRFSGFKDSTVVVANTKLVNTYCTHVYEPVMKNGKLTYQSVLECPREFTLGTILIQGTTIYMVTEIGLVVLQDIEIVTDMFSIIQKSGYNVHFLVELIISDLALSYSLNTKRELPAERHVFNMCYNGKTIIQLSREKLKFVKELANNTTKNDTGSYEDIELYTVIKYTKLFGNVFMGMRDADTILIKIGIPMFNSEQREYSVDRVADMVSELSSEVTISIENYILILNKAESIINEYK